MKKPKKWTEVYPQGTREGDEESKFFRALARTKWDWRSTAQIVLETGLTRERVEEIIEKYAKMDPPLVLPHNTNPDMWGYWERVPDSLKKDTRSISTKDQDGRINKHITGQSMTTNGQPCGCGPGSSCSNCAAQGCTSGTPGGNPTVVPGIPNTITIASAPGMGIPITVSIPNFPPINQPNGFPLSQDPVDTASKRQAILDDALVVYNHPKVRDPAGFYARMNIANFVV